MRIIQGVHIQLECITSYIARTVWFSDILLRVSNIIHLVQEAGSLVHFHSPLVFFFFYCYRHLILTLTARYAWADDRFKNVNILECCDYFRNHDEKCIQISRVSKSAGTRPCRSQKKIISLINVKLHWKNIVFYIIQK